MSHSADRWQAEADAFEFLARCWIAELDQDMVNHLQNPDVGGAWQELGGMVPVSGDSSEFGQSELLNSLALEYCSCFLGPKGHLPPHQSVVSQSRFQGDCVSSMRQYIEIIGKPDRLFAEQQMIDHAGVQLHLMGCLAEDAAERIDRDDPDSGVIDSIADLMNQFHQDHLLWLIPYCELAEKRTGSPFYASLFRVTRAIVSERIAG